MRNRLPGEDTPTWLVAVFALIGALVVTAAAWLWLSAQSAVEQPSPDKPAARQVSAAPAASPAANVAAQPPAARESATEATAAARAGTPPEPAPSSVSSAESRGGEPAESSGQGPGVAAPAPQRRRDCQPVIAIPFPPDNARPIITDVRPALDGLVEFLKRHPEARVAVEGHTDSYGPEDYNLLLSYRRARAVVLLLGASGIKEDRMVIGAAGEFAPLEGVPGNSGENRRVLLQVKGAENCREEPGGSTQ